MVIRFGVLYFFQKLIVRFQQTYAGRDAQRSHIRRCQVRARTKLIEDGLDVAETFEAVE